MKIDGSCRGGELYIVLDGEMDECSVPEVRRKADRLIEEHAGASRAVIDLKKVRFMDSTGIGFLIGRYKKLTAYGTVVYLKDPTESADKVLSLSGVYTLMPKLKVRS